MKDLVIIGAGTAGTMMLNKLKDKVSDEWKFTIIDKDPIHYYQPGFLFIPFGVYEPKDVMMKKKEFIPDSANFMQLRIPSAGSVSVPSKSNSTNFVSPVIVQVTLSTYSPVG